MGIRPTLLVGWGLQVVMDNYNLRDSRLNPDGIVMSPDRYYKALDAGEGESPWSIDGYLARAEALDPMGFPIVKTLTKVGLEEDPSRSDLPDYFHAHEGTLAFTVVGSTRDQRHGDSLDWLRETYMHKPAQTNWVQELPDNPFPYNGMYVNAHSGNEIPMLEAAALQRILAVVAATEPSLREGAAAVTDALFVKAGFKSTLDAVTMMVPKVPVEIRAFCEHCEVFVDPSTIDELRPILWCFWS